MGWASKTFGKLNAFLYVSIIRKENGKQYFINNGKRVYLDTRKKLILYILYIGTGIFMSVGNALIGGWSKELLAMHLYYSIACGFVHFTLIKLLFK